MASTKIWVKVGNNVLKRRTGSLYKYIPRIIGYRGNKPMDGIMKIANL